MNSVAEKLREALELLGPEGENWVNHSPTSPKHCMVTACAARCGDDDIDKHAMWSALREQIDSRDIQTFNGAPERTFSEVREVFQKAIASAEGQP